MGQIVDLQGNGLLLGGNAGFIFSVGNLMERTVLSGKDRGRQGGDFLWYGGGGRGGAERR